MDLIKNLHEIKEVYSKGKNLQQFMKEMINSEQNTPESILISYDFQAGTYIRNTQIIDDYENEYANKIVSYFKQCGQFSSMLEVGVGEATILFRNLEKLHRRLKVYGFDISWSRIKYAQKYLKSKNINNVNLFVGDLFNIPLQDNSIDIVYTSHSLEPNGGKEEEALKELYRVAKRYLCLFEPFYELGNIESKNHIEKHGYVKNLSQTARKLGYEIVEDLILFNDNPLSSNNTGLLLIKKNDVRNASLECPYACPISKMPLSLIRSNYYCKDSLLLYPVVDEVPCLLPASAIIATHYLDNFG
jgi:hypothetical protein